MTYTGVLATILSGLEPAVAIVLACIPLLRPLYKSRRSDDDTSYYHGSGKTSGLSSSAKKGSVAQEHTLSALDSNSSEIQLRPVKPEHDVQVSAAPDGQDEAHFTLKDRSGITVDTRWEVRSDESGASHEPRNAQ